MGFRVIDELSERLGIRVTKLKYNAAIGEGSFEGEKIVLVKPMTFMNLSGEALKPLADYYKVPVENLILAYDDIDVEPGYIRVRKFGSSGSHNGMKSVIYHLGSDRFPRIRVGIGKNGLIPLDKYVLGKPSAEEERKIQSAVKRAAEAALMIISGGIDKAMNTYNGKTDADN